jgi:threonine/homoserine/homoserine lactone efflux protein
MPSWQTIALFIVSALVLNLTPGPAILFILSRCLGQGRKAAVVSVFGLATASLIHTVDAASGLPALLVYSPLAFALVKILRRRLPHISRSTSPPAITGFLSGGVAEIAGRAVPGARLWASACWQGLLVDPRNPKLVLFFFSFLPQFVDPGRGQPGLQVVVLGLLFQLTGVPTNLAIALAGGSFAGAGRAAPGRGLCSAIVLGRAADCTRRQVGADRAPMSGCCPRCTRLALRI